MELAVWPGVTHLERESWDAVVGDDSPFLEHGFLASLEEAGCVGGDTGWYPRIVTAREDGELLGFAPAYVKTHSMGEFVYDWSWADAASRMGVGYYPKLVVAAPFSPVPGGRLVARPDLDDEGRRAVKRALLAGLVSVADDAKCHGVHILFCQGEDLEIAKDAGFMHRTAIQFHWHNHGYRSFDDFLARFRSKRRKNIRRERRKIGEQGVRIHTRLGDEVLDSDLEHAYRFYTSTVDKFFYGRRYLNRPFFELLWQRMRSRLQLVLAEREADGEIIAGALCMEKAGRRYGRYWGTDDDVDCLHFEVCSYAGIDDCIDKGVQVFEAGAGGFGHKYGRGFEPTYVHSAHLVFEPRFHAALADFCEREGRAVRREGEALREQLFVR